MRVIIYILYTYLIILVCTHTYDVVLVYTYAQVSSIFYSNMCTFIRTCFYTPHWKMAFTMSGASKPLIPIAVSDVQAKLPTRVWGVPSYPLLAASGQNHSKSGSQNHLVIGKWDFCVSSCQAAPDFACDQITWFQLKGIPKIPKFFWVIWKLSFTSARTCATWV
jgi:hypothetical protein